MRIRVFRFNTYLLGALAVVLAAGCQSDKPAYSKKDQASLRLHLEVNPDGSDRNGPVAIGRDQPFHLNVETKPFLTEFNIEKAAVIDSLGGFSISVQYDKQGAGCSSNTRLLTKASTWPLRRSSAKSAGWQLRSWANGSPMGIWYSRQMRAAKNLIELSAG